MPLIEIELDIELYCASCGAGICENGSQRRKRQAFDIEPCKRCLEREYDRGYADREHDRGYDDGEREADPEH